MPQMPGAAPRGCTQGWWLRPGLRRPHPRPLSRPKPSSVQECIPWAYNLLPTPRPLHQGVPLTPTSSEPACGTTPAPNSAHRPALVRSLRLGQSAVAHRLVPALSVATTRSVALAVELASPFMGTTRRHVRRVAQAPPSRFACACVLGPVPAAGRERPGRGPPGLRGGGVGVLRHTQGCSLHPPFWTSPVRLHALVLALPENWTGPCSPHSSDRPLH